ncbi:MAG: DUF1016 N-terminal domain-containing protein [Elusimicrobiales bacterium]|nr:DUF1016 N-terminal domain-containing protein [Elusimicrobiales bacterium]
MTKDVVKDYRVLLAEIKGRVRAAQYSALRAVNKELVGLYWDIGRIISERQKGDTWGRSIVEKLAVDLRTEFPGIRGFSTSNLWRMRLLYEKYAQNVKLAPLVREIAWAHKEARTYWERAGAFCVVCSVGNK